MTSHVAFSSELMANLRQKVIAYNTTHSDRASIGLEELKKIYKAIHRGKPGTTVPTA